MAARIAAAFEVEEPTGNPKTLGRDEAYSIDSLALSADGKTLAAAGWFGGSELFVYRLAARPHAIPIKKPRDAFRGLAISPDGKVLFGATRDAIRRFAIDASARPTTIAAGADVSIALSPSGEVLATSTEDGTRLWSSATLAALPAKAKKGFESIAFTPDGRAIVGVTGSTVVVLDAVDLAPQATIRIGGSQVHTVAVANDRVALGSYDPGAPIRVFGLREKRRLFDLAPHKRDGVAALAFSRDGSRLASAGEDGHVRVWDVKKKKLIGDVRGRQEAMGAVVFLHDGRVAAAGRDTSKGPPVYIWSIG